jgi:hypothetical protein
MQKLRVESVCPHDMHVFSAFQPCIETRAIDVVSQHASASEKVLQYKGLHGRFCPHVLCFVSLFGTSWFSGKKEAIPALHPSSLYCASFHCLDLSWYLSRSFGVHWERYNQARHCILHRHLRAYTEPHLGYPERR